MGTGLRFYEGINDGGSVAWEELPFGNSQRLRIEMLIMCVKRYDCSLKVYRRKRCVTFFLSHAIEMTACATSVVEAP